MTTVAIAHDYLTQRGGAERVVLSMLRAFPDATLYTTLYEPEATYPEFRDARIVCSPLNRIGLLRRHHRAALPLLPLAARGLRIDEDVVVASSSGWAHGFNAHGKRLVYCHSPARWLYQPDTYLGPSSSGPAKGLALQALRPFLLRWDQKAAHKADRYLTNSRVVRDRIFDAYGIVSDVVPAPHSLDAHAPQQVVDSLVDWEQDGYHLIVSRLLPYKNVDAAVEAFKRLPDERLVIVGSGPEKGRLGQLAPPNVRMLEGLSDEEIRWVYAHAEVLIAPSIEDYGLTPLEAGTYGKPTLALRAGGYLDTIAEGVSGLFFEAPLARDIRAAVVENKGISWDRDKITSHMEAFGERLFVDRLHRLVAKM